MSLTGGTLAIVFGAMLLLFIGLIVLMRNVYKSRTEKGIAGEYAPAAGEKVSYIENRAKYERVDVFGLSSTFFNFGLALAVGISLLAFAWTQYEAEIIIPEGALELEEEIEMEPPRTAEPPPPPPPTTPGD